MHRTRIKICSICRPEDARLAADAGADAIGLIFHPPSKRNVTPAQAREIVRALPPFVTPVGIFVDATPQHIREVARHAGVTHLQLHGAEPEETIAALADFTLVKAVKVHADTFRADLERWDAIAARHPQLRGLVLETATAESGGTGIPNDWPTIRRVLADRRPHLAIIAAGGLTPDNVGAVIRDIRPHAVDVSSGVEEAVRVKSAIKVTRFIDAVRTADAG